MTNTFLRMHFYFILMIALTVLFLWPDTAWAAGSSMPWESPLDKVLKSVQGPVAKIIGTMAIILTGLSLSFGDAGGGFRRLLQIVFGLTIAFTASSFFLSFFKFGGGAVI